jgi:hypothetical protein
MLDDRRARAGSRETRLVCDARQHRLEGDARPLQRSALEVEHVDVQRRKRALDYRLVEAGALVATLVSDGVIAILTSTSLTGFWVQAWVT